MSFSRLHPFYSTPFTPFLGFSLKLSIIIWAKASMGQELYSMLLNQTELLSYMRGFGHEPVEVIVSVLLSCASFIRVTHTAILIVSLKRAVFFYNPGKNTVL